MKKIFSLLFLSIWIHASWAQSGEGYDPQNPADPGVYYSLMLEASPRSGGTVSPDAPQKVAMGQSVYISTHPQLGYEFKCWMMGDSLVSSNRNFYFTMPEKDVVLTAYYDWNPEYDPKSPGDPASEGYVHHVRVYAEPSSGGYFNSSNFSLLEGTMSRIYAYPYSGYRFESWMCNGEVVSTENPLNIKMGTSDISYTATFVYDPTPPGDPSPNVFNPMTGELVVDNFTPGSLNDAIYRVIGYDNYSLVQSVVVVGRMTASDFGFSRYFTNCTSIDLSRTTGFNEVPYGVFDGCSALERLWLPSSVEQVGDYAFIGCSNLSEVYCYAATPPAVSAYSFYGVEGLVVKVPSSSVALYQNADGWKDFPILPVDDETCRMLVTLPDDAKDGRYKNMFVELQNAISGQTYKYLITDRRSYTFANLIRNTAYNVYVKNASGAVLGQKEKVMVGEEDVTVAFDSLLQPQVLTVKVLVPDGSEVTDQVSVTWMYGDGTLLANGVKANGVLEGSSVICRVVLPQSLALEYRMPADIEHTVTPSGNVLTCQLRSFDTVTLTGRVLDVTKGQAIAGASVTVSQLLNGKYTKSVTSQTDYDGRFKVNVHNEPGTMTVSAADYQSKSVDYAGFSGEPTVGDVLLKPATGVVVSVALTYTENVEDGKTAVTQDWYPDEGNVTYSIQNLTQGRQLTQQSQQNGNIVLLEEVSEGDELAVTARSKTGRFDDVTVTAVIDAGNRVSVTIPVVEHGSLKVSCSESSNQNGVAAMVYDGDGVLLRKMTFSSDTLAFGNLPDGSYTVVAMGNSAFYNSVLHLSELANAGLTEDRDYVARSVAVSSGKVTTLNFASVPTFDESKFYYTGKNTSFSSNKSQVVIGNYVTLKAKVDFKDEYAHTVSDLQLVVDLPDGCQFVDNSVLTGSGTAGYEWDGSRVVIPVNKQNDLIRFCIIPTTGGTCKPSAFVQFYYDGKTIQQPIGSAYFEAENLAISIPALTADSVVIVNGTAPSDCLVRVFDGDVLVGQTRSLANGRWSAKVNLFKPYSHSFHNVYAEVTTSDDMTLLTDTRNVEYDRYSTQLKTVTMLYNGNTIVFDQIEGTTSTNTYSYAPSVNDFTFIAKFTKNDTALVRDLQFLVLTSDGRVRRVASTFSTKYSAWVGKATFANSSSIPVNVVVDYRKTPTNANTYDQIDVEADVLAALYKHMEQAISEDATISLVSTTDGEATFELQYGDDAAAVRYVVKELDYDEALAMVDRVQFDFVSSGDGYLLRYVDADADSVVMTLIDSEEHLAMRISVVTDEPVSLSRAKKGSLTRNMIASLKGDWRSGKLFSDIIEKVQTGSKLAFAKDFWRAFLDLLGIQRYLDAPHFETWCDLIMSYMDEYIKQSESITPLLTAKCPDGSKRLTNEEIDQFYKRLTGINDQTSLFMDTYYEYLKLYQMKLKNSVVCFALSNLATLGLGEVVGAGTSKLSTKAMTFLRGKLGDKMTYNMSKWVKNSIGIPLEALGGKVEEIANPFKEGGFTDFEGVAKELDTWGPEQNKTFLMLYADLKEDITAAYKSCKKDDDPDDPNDDNSDGDGQPDDNNDDKGKPQPNTPPLKPSIDPSGYVYEGVASNRIQGVMATAYYKESKEDMYGVITETPVVWDAAEYAQQNPLFTDENGMYQWDVPQGLWQVKFEKEGYETAYSEWLPVPPPQLEVNIGLVQAIQPEVKLAHAYNTGVEIEFDKYMQLEQLTTDNILVSQNGEYVDGAIELLNEEKAYDDESIRFASKLRFVPSEPFSATEVTLTVSNRVKSYAGLQMQDTYIQTLDIEQQLSSIEADSVVSLVYGSSKTVTVKVVPAATSAGKTLHVTTSSAMIASVGVDTCILDEEGQTEILITGELPGTTLVTYSLDGYDIMKTIVVKVEANSDAAVATPTSSIASGSEVERGAEVSLSCATEGVTIYYTTDGSCPCDAASRKVYDGTPIVISQAVTIKAIAVAADGTESDVAAFTYIVKDDSGIDDVTVGRHIQISPLPIRDRVTVTAGGQTIKSVSLMSIGGVLVASSNMAAKEVTFDISTAAAGIYIIRVVTSNGTFSQKVQKTH